MDCEKCEPLLLDELYEELDELTSAAVKRHVSGCARCGAILTGMRQARRAVSLPLVPVPEGLEDRILAAAKEAQKVVPMRSRMSRFVSIAGSWAMRPQTAMAAVFLLMIGTSAVLIRSKNYASRDSAVSVTVQGSPSPTPTVAGQSESVDDNAAAAAHGPSTSNATRPPVVAASAFALNEPASDEDSRDKGDLNGLGLRGIGAGGGSGPNSEMLNAAAPAGAPNDSLSQQAAQPATGFKRSGPEQAQDPYSLGAAAFRARNYAEATTRFDQAAQSGDLNAALWAAESTREGQGCAMALGRFEQVAQKGAGTWTGHEASLRAARCQIAMGQLDAARERLDKLAQVPSHQASAQQALSELQVATKAKGGGGATGGAVAAPKRAAPARATSPVRAPTQTEQKKASEAADHAAY